MSLTHDFMLCDLPIDVDFENILSFYRLHRCCAIQIDDKWMLKCWSKFNIVHAYWQGVAELESGLNYCGFSLIPNMYIPELLKASSAFPYCVVFKNLRMLCTEAMQNNSGILHMGI